MLLNKKTIKYKDKVVFEKVEMSSYFNRIPKIFQEQEACFLFLTKGSFQFRTPTDTIRINEGEAMLAKCGNYFIEEINAEPAPSQDSITVIGAYFYPELVKQFFQSDLSIANFQHNYDAKRISVEPLLNAFIKSINYLLDNPALADSDLILNKLKELLILLNKSSNYKSINNFVISLFTPYEYNFKEIIQSVIYSNLSLIEIANLCNCSLSTFKRKFKKQYTESPSKYILSKKLQKSTELLHIKSMSISDIAFESGFENVASFNRVFKTRFEKSPTEYRLN